MLSKYLSGCAYVNLYFDMITLIFYIFKQWSYSQIMVYISQPIYRGKNPLAGKNAAVRDGKLKLDLYYFLDHCN